MRSVGSAAAQGLESGLNLGLRMQAQQQDAEDRGRRIKREDEDRAYLIDQRRRRQEEEEFDQAMRAIDGNLATLRSEGEGYAQQYGGSVPREIDEPYRARVSELTGIRDQLLRKRYQPIIEQRQRSMREVLTRLDTDPAGLGSIDPADLYGALTTALRRDPRELLGGADGAPSRVGQAVDTLMRGLETGDEGSLLDGANVLLEPDLKIGVGQESPHGGTIVGKRIVAFAPHPQAPGQFTPVLRVYVSDGKIDTAGEVARAERIRAEDPNAPPNATGYYLAPVTENRSTDRGDNVKSISLQRAMEYAGQMQTLAMVLTQHPELRAKVEQGAAAAGGKPDSFLAALYATGGKMPAKQIDWKTLKPGERMVGLDPRGRQVASIEGPEKAPPATGLGGQVSAIQAYADEHGITFEEAAALFQRRGLLRAPGKGARGAEGGAGLPAPKSGATGEAALSGLSEDDATIVRGLADGSVRPSEISTRGNRRERMLALAKRYDPAADFGPNGRLKDIPAAVQTAVTENQTNLRRAERALRLVGGAPAKPGETQDADATGFKGYIPNQLLNRWDPKGVEARAAIADLGSLVIHSRSGAAVTAQEFPRLAPFIPSEKDDAPTVKKKLRGFVAVYQEELEALRSTYSRDNGYKGLKTPAGGGGGAAPPEQPAPDAPGQGAAAGLPKPPAAAGARAPAAQLPKIDRRGWRLMEDGQGNKAYVSPDGMHFEEVR